jgi:hypothetical protein
MRKIILLLLLISTKSYSQETYKGSIVDKNSKETLSYVNIGVVEKRIRFNNMQRISKQQLEILNKMDMLKSIKKQSDSTYIDEKKKLE